MKSLRQEKILELIKKHDIETQDELIEMLRFEGFDVTQATASRDIKELKLLKTLNSKGKYRYTKQVVKDAVSGVKFNSALADSIMSVECGCNIVVVKTFPGMANAVATGIDSIQHSEILGSVAGDDTIIIVTKDAERAVEISKRIQVMVQSI